MHISNGALCNTHQVHAAQIKLIHIDLNKREQSYIGILLADLANNWQFFRLFTVVNFQKFTVDRTTNPSLLGFNFFNYGEAIRAFPNLTAGFPHVLWLYNIY